VYANVPCAATIWLVSLIVSYSSTPKRRCVMSDYEAVVAAVEEAQRILAIYGAATSRRNQDDFLAMLQFILCDPSVAVAVR